MKNLQLQEIFWHNLGSGEMKYLRESGGIIEHSPDDIIFRQGERSNGGYMIISGEVELCDEGATGNDLIPVCTLTSGMVLGNINGFSTQIQTVTAKSKDNVILFKMERAFVEKMFERSPKAAAQIFLNVVNLMSQNLNCEKMEKELCFCLRNQG